MNDNTKANLIAALIRTNLSATDAAHTAVAIEERIGGPANVSQNIAGRALEAWRDVKRITTLACLEAGQSYSQARTNGPSIRDWAKKEGIVTKTTETTGDSAVVDALSAAGHSAETIAAIGIVLANAKK